MATTAVCGLQWGDEGKGKLVSKLAQNFQYVVRYQGGGNAGHTVYAGDRKIVLKHIPSGILVPGVHCFMMPGMVLDPETLFDELNILHSLDIQTSTRLRISGRVHITASYHKALDQLRERAAGDRKIGTTGRGIGITYADKANRVGIRVADLLDERALREQVEHALRIKNPIIEALGGTHVEPDAVHTSLVGYGRKLAPYIDDTPMLLAEALARGENVLFEGAQAAMLDLDIGTYPYVTSSNTTAGGIGAGCGCNVGRVDEVVGVVKAYCTRVGEGPFPTELKDSVGEHLRNVGHEFGSTTGRPRRCGWFDAFAVRCMAKLGAVSALCVTKLDVLTGVSDVKIATGYRGWTKHGLPETSAQYATMEPVYETMPGFEGNLAACHSFADLPPNARRMLLRIEELCGVRVRYISVGPGTEQLIDRGATG